MKDKESYTTVLIIVVIIIFSVIAFPVFYAIIQNQNYVISKQEKTLIEYGKVYMIVPDSIADEGKDAINKFVLEAIE